MFKAIIFLLCCFFSLPVFAEEPYLGEPVDPSLAEVPYRYARINSSEDEIAGMYYDIISASIGKDPVKEIGFGKNRYVSYSERAQIDGADYVRTKEGLWMRGSPAEIVSVPNGRILSREPDPFGWILRDVHASIAAGVLPEDSGKLLLKGDILPYYEAQECWGTLWYRVGERQWVDGGSFAAADFRRALPSETEGEKRILVDIPQQVLIAYEGNRPVFAALIASGLEDFTRPGVFRIQNKLDSDDMFGALKSDKSDYFYLEDVPFTMYFDEERAFHGIYWPASLGFKQSHGCINMTIGDAHWLFDWADIGTTVYITEEP